MPRLMSVAHTEGAVRRRAKTVTRRNGWSFLCVGDVVTLCPKVMGRRGGKPPLERLVDVQIVDVRREQLQEVTPDDVVAEGFPGWSRDQFLDSFTGAMGGTRGQVVTRIEWRYLEPPVVTIEKAIQGYRFLYADEKALQHGISEALGRAGLSVHPEVSLNPRGRIDFLVHQETRIGGKCLKPTGIEVKVAGSPSTVLAQLQRYAPYCEELVLVTTKASHCRIPAEVGGKPVRVVHIRGAAW